MEQRLTRSTMDVRLISTRSKSPIGSVSPLHNQPKTSGRSASPLPNQEKACKASASPFRGFVSPYNNQQKTSRDTVSPNNSQQKTPRCAVSSFRGSVSPYNNQPKTPRGSVSPFRGSVYPSNSQEKKLRGAVSPIHNQTKNSIGPVSRLHNQSKVSTGSVSPLHNQPNTRRGYVSPLNNQVKTTRAYVSPIHHQAKAPRAYVSPLIDEEIPPVGSISSLHNNEKGPIITDYPSQNEEKCSIYPVSPAQNEGNTNGHFVSPLQNEENVKIDSVSPIQNQEKPLPNYLQASSSSCHDICKYGSRNNLEEERAKNIVRRKKSKIIKLRSLSSGKIVFSEKIEFVSVEGSNSNDEGTNPVEWKDIVSYDAFASLKETKTQETEVVNTNLDVGRTRKLVDKNKRQAIRIKDASSKTEELESKTSNSVDRRNKKQDLKLKETIVRNEIDKERYVRNEIDKERDDASSKTKMDSSKKAYNRKEENEATTSKSKSDEIYTKISDKFKQIEKATTQKQSIINVLQLSKGKKYPSSKSGELQPENPNSTERKNKKDMIQKDDKEKNNLEKNKKDASSKTKMDSIKKLYKTKDDKEATTSKPKPVNEESHGRFTTEIDKFNSMEKNNKINMYKICKEKHSPRKKSFFSITRNNSGRRSHEGKIDKVVNRPKNVLNTSTSSSNEPKEKTLHTMEQKSRKVGSRLSRSKSKEDQENAPKPEKSKFRKGKVVELPHDQNSPRKLRFRNKRGSNENLSGFQIGRKSLRRKGSINASSSNPNGQIVMLKHHNGAQEKKGLQGLFNSIIEETVNKLVKTRKSKVRALVGAFETVISLQDKKSVHVN